MKRTKTTRRVLGPRDWDLRGGRRHAGLNRRTFLRGVLGGTAVAVGLPWLEAMSGVSPRARAQDGSFPTRFGIYFWGNGVLPDKWIPADEGEAWTLSEQLAPLANVQQHLAVLSGLEVKVDNTVAHASGPGGLFSGDSLDVEGNDYTFRLPSIDQRIAQAVGGATRFRSIEAGVQEGGLGMSFSGKDARVPPEADPIQLYSRLFGQGFVAPGEEPIVDPTLGLRRSVLDAVMDDAKALESRLGALDKVRLDKHMANVRDLEKRLQKLEEEPPSLASCARPDEPGLLPDIDGRPQMLERTKAIADILTMAFACDLTRVGTLWYSDPLADVLYQGANTGHHQLTHDEPGDQPTVNAIVTEIVEGLSYYIERLASVQEGEGTLLDHMALLATTDVSYGRTHQIDEYPIVVAGRANGSIRNGFHYRATGKQSASHVPLTLMRAMGMNEPSFGVDDAFVDTGLSELEA